MNKILNINLGGYALTIDDDAHEYLQSYLDSIKRRFSESDGRDEIMRDVETRLGELITQYMGNHTIVMLPHVESAVQIMGKPEDFGGDEAEPAPSSSKSDKGGGGIPVFGQTIKTGKKLFRDENDAIIGGVCSGLASYFGIHDPVWMRLIFVILGLVSFGFWVPVYLLLWIIVAPARSASERLSMKGEPVNVDSIAKEFEKGYDRLSKRMSETAGERFNVSQSASGCLSVLGRVALGFLILIVAGLVIGLGTAWVAGIFAFFTAQPILSYFSPLSAGSTYFGVFCLFIVMGLPVVSLCLWMARTIFKVRTPGWLRGGLSVFWVLSLISLFAVGVAGARKFRSGSTVTKTVDLSGVQSDTLRVDWDHFTENDRPDWEWPWDDADIYIGHDRVEMRDFVRIRVHRSTSGRFECQQEIRARGATSAEAADNANQTEYQVSVDGNTLRVPNNMIIAQGKKWFGRLVTINIGVPEGKSFVFGKDIYNYAAADLDEYADDNDRNYISRSPETVFLMTNEGIRCAACPSFGDSNYESDRNYSKFVFEGDFEIDIRQGDDFKLSMEGDKNIIQKIRSGEKLTLTTNGKSVPPGTRVIIETPDLESLLADNTGLITIRGFEQDHITISAKGKSTIKANLDARGTLEVLLSGLSSLDVSGEGGDLDANLTGSSVIDATNWRADRVNISASGTSKAQVYAKNGADVKAESTSDVKVEGTENVNKK